MVGRSSGNYDRPGMARRSYEQLCTLARTLDVVGERWTLLLIRELMLGPQRFTDLIDGLPGIGRNLLAERLRALTEAGLIEHAPPPPPPPRAYRLTDDGRALGPALAELGRWGAERLPDPDPAELLFRPAWAMFPLAYMANRDAARGIRQVYEFRIGEASFHLRVEDGRVEPRTGVADAPDVVVSMSADTLAGLFARSLTPEAAVAAGAIGFEGPPKAIVSCLAILAGEPTRYGQP